jgi:hypothetical protein
MHFLGGGERFEVGEVASFFSFSFDDIVSIRRRGSICSLFLITCRKWESAN